MSIALKPDSFLIKASGSWKNPKLPANGGNAKVKFTAAMSNPKKKIRATVALTPNSYALAGGAHEQQTVLDCLGGINQDAVYEQDLEISHTSTEVVERIIVTLVLQELHSNGKPTKDKPLTAGGDIVIREMRDRERKAVGKALAEMRKDTEKTQADVAHEDLSGLSVSTISKAERGVPVSDESLLTLLATLKGN